MERSRTVVPAKITAAQVRIIWVLAKRHGFDEDLLRTKVKAITGSESISAMTKTEAARVIDTLIPGRAANMATKKQLWLIDRLSKELGWDDNPKRLQGFAKKYAGVDNINWLTADKAWRLIEGLKKIRARLKNKNAE